MVISIFVLLHTYGWASRVRISEKEGGSAAPEVLTSSGESEPVLIRMRERTIGGESQYFLYLITIFPQRFEKVIIA